MENIEIMFHIHSIRYVIPLKEKKVMKQFGSGIVICCVFCIVGLISISSDTHVIISLTFGIAIIIFASAVILSSTFGNKGRFKADYAHEGLLALFLSTTIITLGYGSFLLTHNSPEVAIRRHLLVNSPHQSLSCHITKTNIVDKISGQQYIIKDFIDPESGGAISFAYVKKNSLGIYYWSGGGSGP